MSNPWYVGPPTSPPPHHYKVAVHYLPKYHFQQYIISRFGFPFWVTVVQSPDPVVLPIITYGDLWVIALYVLE